MCLVPPRPDSVGEPELSDDDVPRTSSALLNRACVLAASFPSRVPGAAVGEVELERAARSMVLDLGELRAYAAENGWLA